MVARSRTGCLTCRHRKLKCDEQRPRCGQCQKAQRECVPSDGIVFRHQQNASMNDPDDHDGDSLQGFYAYKNTFTKDSVWVKIPKRITFVVNADPEADFSIDEAQRWEKKKDHKNDANNLSSPDWPSSRLKDEERPASRAHGLEALSAAASSNPYIVSPQPNSTAHLVNHARQTSELLRGAPTPSSATHSTSTMTPPANSFFSQVLNPIPQSSGTQNTDSNVFTGLAFQRLPYDDEVESDHEVAFLFRHYTEGPGPWMDLFDLDKYFTNYVPVRAMTNPILKNAICAYAAKQLSLVNGRKPVLGGAASTMAPSELYPNITKTDWTYKATKYYDQAIKLLRDGIRDGIVGIGPHSPEQEQGTVASPLTSSFGSPGLSRTLSHSRSESDSQLPPYEWKKRRKVSRGSVLSDEMTAATAILCDYEQMQEGAGVAWNRHLDGTKSLLEIIASSVMPLQAPQSMPRTFISRARQAAFWNFARQDFLSALITERQTRLDPADIPMWRDAGLAIDQNGLVEPSNLSRNGLPEGPDVMKEDMISNALIWIMDKVVNYAVAADTGPGLGRETWEGINQQALMQTWSDLYQQLAVWHTGLPDSFKPCAQLYPQTMSESVRGAATVFPEIWYNNPMCASTMQSYHMALMILLLNMPQQSTIGKTTYFKRLSSYKNITHDIEAHAIAICGIAVSRPESAVRIHSIHPLFTAGQSLGGTRERLEVVRLLQDIEADTGWTTDYRVRRLYEEWSWPKPEGPDHDKSMSSAAMT